MAKAIVNGSIFTGHDVIRGHSVLIDGARIAAIVNDKELPEDVEVDFDLDGGTLVPGFIDLQVNGGGGVLLNDEPTVAGIRVIAETHRQFGTTGILPTLISTDFDTMRQAIEAVDDAIEEGVPGVLGIHLEGPFLNVDRKGAHESQYFCPIDDEAIKLMTSLKRGKTLVTIAPELTSPATIERLADSGVTIAAGHSAATFDQVQLAINAGLTGFTHLFNATTQLQGREPGIVGAAILDDATWFGIIADGHHVHPASFQIAVTAKKTGHAILVTDAMPPVGSESDSFELGGETIRSVEGRCINAAGSLAGSDLNLMDAVNNAADFAQIDWFEAVRMASAYPAKAIGVEEHYGAIRSGGAANLVAVDENRNVTRTWIDGDGK